MGKNLTINNFTMFKCLQFIDNKLRQLNEADEMPDEEMGGEEEAAPMDDMEGGEEMGGDEPPMGEEDPSQIADVDNGTFVSDLGNAEVAKTMLKALTMAKPNEPLPPQFQTVTTQNADQVIQYVKTMLSIESDEFEGNLNNI